ncbi:Bestrophin, RFP-TM, chloride channel-domain-containing protein [Lentinula guzmanii]|uniref:Bestrophin, RFP-TM, chloride channel-domain-containing protein n=3 Tax=Lentinula TaxID=5352 RepID=A0AA38MWQ6_9AGAR|nr:Bestrophin, RFP-TM, chloride channel-domain-containing protein [Lentinula guzmanii]KAJ3788602.1 Bestrophin, RFP-TM, chloride channel-domain-containing protein [Lentinula aff. detonsa]KAJ3801365.1 Bestrophin, RFP-TM, chloride channel-domain-containing protein [Lentinula aff. detonsa]KAJ4001424.1 Bestrophin, RFP-TM, chloride channel-domain-containing protein [Lentinula boryana]
MSDTGTKGSAKRTLTSVFPSLRPKRKHLRKYSWLPDVFRIKGSIIRRIFWPVTTNTLFATIIAYAWHNGRRIALTNSIVPLLSVVVGLILVFRNGSSYDRFWEGRKSFATVTSNVRNLSRQIWVNVALPPSDQEDTPSKKGKAPILTASQLHRVKSEALHLCLAFPFAVKHYLRGEDGLNWSDYHDVLPKNFARFDEVGYQKSKTDLTTSYNSISTKSSGRSSPDLGRGDATKRVRPKRSKQNLPSQSTPLLSGAVTHRTVEFRPFADDTSLPLPLIIAHEISRLLFYFRREGLLETVGPAGTNAMNALVQSMVDNMTAMERIANTPIPISYGIHLKQCVTLYLFALPLTLVNDLGWMTIPIVTVVAFTFMGIEGIADEIEMPFGHDPSDLPLDRYCLDLKEEVLYIIERLPESGEGIYGYDDGEGDD